MTDRPAAVTAATPHPASGAAAPDGRAADRFVAIVASVAQDLRDPPGTGYGPHRTKAFVARGRANARRFDDWVTAALIAQVEALGGAASLGEVLALAMVNSGHSKGEEVGALARALAAELRGGGE